jgi:adenylate cyclase
MPHLRVITPDGRIYDYSILKSEISIGRGKDNDLILKDDTISRNHALIVKTKEGYLLSDQGSFNGIKVNESPVQSVILKDHDLIKIGLTHLTFLSRKKTVSSLPEAFVLTSEDEGSGANQRIIQSSIEPAEYGRSQELLVLLEPIQGQSKAGQIEPSKVVPRESRIETTLSSLERSNKVLFVLYEISRQLNSIQDFNTLLRKIMDLIFVVINADYGFLILTGEKEDELIPVVVKARDEKQKRPLKASRTIIKRVIRDKVALLTSNAMTDSRLDHAQSVIIEKIRSAMCVPLWRKDKIMGVIQLDSVRLNNPFSEEDLQILKTIGSQMAMVIEQASLNEQIREEERLRNRLERFHSPQVIDMIIKGSQEAKDHMMEPKDIMATILFTDIIGFSYLAEKMPPREINMLLTNFFSRMTDIVFKYDGTLDKYIGDGLMAVFGAPIEKKDDPIRAVRAALEMREELKNMMVHIQGGKKFNIRIGLNTGRVVAGTVGSPRRMDYTVIGDAVNIASRLESMAQPNQILIGEETWLKVKDVFKIDKVGPRKVRGKSNEIMVYEVIASA